MLSFNVTAVYKKHDDFVIENSISFDKFKCYY